MNEDRFQRLSEYLDGELSEAERAALEQELETDAVLAGLLEELQEVKRVAGEADDRGPETDLWPAIAARIDAERVVELKPARHSRRRLTFTVPQFAAAMIATLVMGTGALWMARSLGEFVGGEPAATASADAGNEDSTSPTNADLPVRLVESAEPRNPSRKSDVAIAALEAHLAEGRDNLDSSTVRIIEESLATIDRAIESASAALEADPGNVWLNRHLADSKSRKVRLLEKAAALTAVRT
jgi:anti-sigma factor RsiW